MRKSQIDLQKNISSMILYSFDCSFTIEKCEHYKVNQVPKLFSKFLLCVFLLGNSAAVAMHQESEVAQPVLSHILEGRWAYTFCYYQGENKLLRKEVPTQAMNIAIRKAYSSTVWLNLKGL